ncbi:hypothetical protein SAMN04515671_1787 [Nakamurella panacisegetis]|uniref:Lipoprotein n=2 Tax=Nakamurella panacisegetis TaxID=1090615 RepID=A0A1H0LSL7_9ACTN|nr:hypothetical protein SAMN04515671_1787 [Nakamurella panacisegetis]
MSVPVKRGLAITGVLIAVTLLLTGCAAGPNTAAGPSGQPAGFWLGLWHGFIAPVTFLVSLFNSHVNIYEVHNSGNWYNFGFMIGLSVIFSALNGPRAAVGRARRRTSDRSET